MNRTVFCFFPLLAMLAACSSDDLADPDTEGALTATEDIGVDVTADGHLVIPRSALDTRVYRLAATWIYPKLDDDCPAPPATYVAAPPDDLPDTCFYDIYPNGTRRVTFSESGDRLVMRESGGEPALELGSFVISGRTDDAIELVFAPDALHTRRNIADVGPALDVTIRAGAKFRTRKAAGWVSVQQDATMSIANKPPGPARVKWGLQAEPARKTGFRAVAQRAGAKYSFEVDGPTRPVAKFDFTNGQVLKLRSVGAPGAYKAVADHALAAAIDYWNRVFQTASGETGRTFVAIDTAAVEAFAHDPGFNVVQWMNNPLNGTSKGQFQNDLTTGETLYGNAYISAGFFGFGEREARALYRFANAQPAPEAAVERFLADYMFETVAHEIGHVLGLQHDYEASNIGEGLTTAQLPDLARKYFASGEASPRLSISIMEYVPAPIAAMLGGYIRKNILPHDLRAISIAYYGKTPDLARLFGEVGARAATLPYCNDDDVAQTPHSPTCMAWDHPLCLPPPTAKDARQQCFAGENDEPAPTPTNP